MINREPIPYTRKGRFRKVLWIVLGIGFVGLITLRSLATLWTDYLWYSSVGQVGVWSTLVFTRLWLVLAASLFTVGIAMFVWNFIQYGLPNDEAVIGSNT